MIRYLALAFIFFQVATTTALATQVVLFESESAQIALPVGSAGEAPTQPISLREMAGGPETRATERLLIQINNGNTGTSSMND